MHIAEQMISPKGFFILVCLLSVVIMLWILHAHGIEAIRIWLKQAGPGAYLLYLLLYVVLSLFLLPIVWLNVTAGLLFGPVLGSVMILLGTLLAASITFLISRKFVNRQWVQQKIANQSQLLEKAVSQSHSWKAVLVLRVSNMVPFAVINYFAGTMEIRFSSYLLATFIGSIPGTIISSGLGALIYALLKPFPAAS